MDNYRVCCKKNPLIYFHNKPQGVFLCEEHFQQLLRRARASMGDQEPLASFLVHKVCQNVQGLKEPYQPNDAKEESWHICQYCGADLEYTHYRECPCRQRAGMKQIATMHKCPDCERFMSQIDAILGCKCKETE